MTTEELRKAVREGVSQEMAHLLDDEDGPFRSPLRSVNQRLDKVLRQRNLALLTALVGFLAAIAGVTYAITSREALSNELTVNRIQLCNSALSSALAFREPQISSKGIPEPRSHFLARMLQQREGLRFAAHFNCGELHGFAQFDYLRSKALNELEQILYQLAPKRFPRHRRASCLTCRSSRGSPPAVAAAPVHAVPALPLGAGQSPAAGAGPTGQPSPQSGGHPSTGHTPGGGAGGGGGGRNPSPSAGSAPSAPASTEAPETASTGIPTGSTGSSGSTTTTSTAPEPPGLIEPVLELVCEVTAGVRLCTRR